jgi:hypothetical protein
MKKHFTARRAFIQQHSGFIARSAFILFIALAIAGCDKDNDPANDDEQVGGNVATPPLAASTQTWVFGDQTWSDAINCPECNKDRFENSYTNPQCRSYTSGTDTWYYYNWPYVAANLELLCPTPWRVPTVDDFVTLVKNTNGRYLIDSWGLPGFANSNSMDDIGSASYFWSATELDEFGAYVLCCHADHVYLDAWYWYYNKHYGQSVRCVK